MNKRLGQPASIPRAKELALKVVERFEEKGVPPEVAELSDNVMFKIALTLRPQDFIDMGFRMQPKQHMAVCDETVFGDIVGGMHALETSGFGNRADYMFIREVVKEIREILKHKQYLN